MSDVEPEPTPGTPADLDKQGGLKDPNETPGTSGDHTGQSEVEDDAHGGEGGGMIGEG